LAVFSPKGGDVDVVDPEAELLAQNMHLYRSGPYDDKRAAFPNINS